MEEEITNSQSLAQPIYCKHCSEVISQNDFFCPSCGKKIKSKPLSMNILPLIWLFILSAVFPPFGLKLTIRHIKDSNKNIRLVGWISLIVTIAVIILSIFYTVSFVQNINQQINSQLGHS